MTTQANTRVAFRDALMELAADDPRYVLVCSDSGLVIKAQPFIEQFPDRIFEVGISEQNAVNVAAGLASCGLIPFFATIRALSPCGPANRSERSWHIPA